MSVCDIDAVDEVVVRRSELKKVLSNRDEVRKNRDAASVRRQKLQDEFEQMTQRYRAEISEADSEVYSLERLLNHNVGSAERELIETSSFAGAIEEKKAEIKAASFLKGDPILPIKRTALRVAEDNFNFYNDPKFENEIQDLELDIANIEARLKRLNDELSELVAMALAE